MTTPSSTQKIALVTGGNKGIGIAIVRGLAREGFTVLLGARSAEVGQAAADTIDGGVRPVVLDVTNQEQINALAAEVAAEFGRLDVLVNNAGGQHPHVPVDGESPEAERGERRRLQERL
ncbi:SDR family NAD(P)-dependent oxidoreductase [Curtobacterium sp. MCJR17_020]|uniref:SDR family NAD(P)-dependent oxidoreductase n=1 Tax=Curtobacterium sp. MCJR17_020 TaxID=2175619 RepID=UPI001C64E20D|nr:SDR family NAD(P)-dependent oxidoreductase [Curtobacterium sp. MCJR17_020]WIE74101.1 SDR family NAD(P)-dependent oxidoreductase [Curtobacterium sp. MCJR17_020]